MILAEDQIQPDAGCCQTQRWSVEVMGSSQRGTPGGVFVGNPDGGGLLVGLPVGCGGVGGQAVGLAAGMP